MTTLVQGSTTIVKGLQTRLIWTPGAEGGTFPEEGNFGGAVTEPVPGEGAGQMIGCGLLTLCLSMPDQGRSGEYQPVQKRVLIPDRKQYTMQWKSTRWNPPGIKTPGESTVDLVTGILNLTF